MNNKISVALLISTYDRPEALSAVLNSVAAQTVLPDEILIADDGSDLFTREVIEEFREYSNVTVKHFWQKHEGFQKAVILNKAVAGTKLDYVVQIDGDVVLHKNFIEDHRNAAEAGHFIRGSRVVLDEFKTKLIIDGDHPLKISSLEKGIHNRINSLRIPFIAPLFNQYSKRSDNMHGCNCSFWRLDFVKVNGYNNRFKGWGHEDIELAARFVNAGLSQKKIKMRAVCYHLYHTVAERCSVETNYRFYEDCVRSGSTFCINGYSQRHAYQQN